MVRKIFVFLILVMCFNLIAAATTTQTSSCQLIATLLNQDPYPAVPGETVKVVFQIKGLQDPLCGNVKVSLVDSFPFTMDPESQRSIEVKAGTFVSDFKSYLLAPYKIRVDEDAVEGDNQIKLDISTSAGKEVKKFNINVEDLRTDFEVSIKDYVKATNTITFEILNTGEHDVEALTIDLPKQETLEVKGSSRNIVGSLDSNDDTTFSFEATPYDGEITVIVTYTDEINERRTLEKIVVFDSSYFSGRVGEDAGRSPWVYIVAVVILVVVYFYWRARRKRKKNN